MSECRWLKPEMVGQFELVEWTSDNHLRHSRFIALRDDKRPKKVVREFRRRIGKPTPVASEEENQPRLIDEQI